jgi:hypothetical protein
VRLVQRYLAAMPAQMRASLPPALASGTVRDTEDLADWAFRLTQRRMNSFDDDPALTEVEQFFARACVHASKLLDRTGGWKRRARNRYSDEGESDLH